LITGNEGDSSDKNIEIYKIKHKKQSNTLYRLINYFITQLKISYVLFKHIKKLDIIIFFIGGDTLILPMFVCKIFRKKAVLLFSGSQIKTGQARKDFFTLFLKVLSSINLTFSDHIILYSNRLINEWNLNRYEKKIIISHRHFINFEHFHKKKEFLKRNNRILYIGRFEEEKGFKNLVNSFEKVIKNDPKIQFELIGNGPLMEYAKEYIYNNNLSYNVIFSGWVNHDSLNNYLNNSKLVILPSFTEGLPNIMLESMACGTPLVANSVGAIPDVIIHGKNGFLLKDNSTDEISKWIFSAMNNYDLELISKEAEKTIINNFSKTKTMELFKSALESIGD
jgi:glycosyltransferase involved in cell wall biosynthesis